MMTSSIEGTLKGGDPVWILGCVCGSEHIAIKIPSARRTCVGAHVGAASDTALCVRPQCTTNKFSGTFHPAETHTAGWRNPTHRHMRSVHSGPFLSSHYRAHAAGWKNSGLRSVSGGYGCNKPSLKRKWINKTSAFTVFVLVNICMWNSTEIWKTSWPSSLTA